MQKQPLLINKNKVFYRNYDYNLYNKIAIMINLEQEYIEKDDCSEKDWASSESYELLSIDKGSANLITTKKKFSIKEGDIILIFPNTLRKLELNENLSLKKFSFDESVVKSFNSEYNKNEFYSKSKHAPLTLIFKRKAEYNTAIQQYLDYLFDEYDPANKTFTLLLNSFVLFIFYYVELELKNKQETTDKKKQDSQINKMISFCNSRYNKNVTLKEIASSASLSERGALRVFKETINDTPTQYILKKRLHEAARLLKEDNDLTVKEIGEQCGFNSPAYFVEIFHRYYKKTPKEYQTDHNITKWSDNPFGALEEFFAD